MQEIALFYPAGHQDHYRRGHPEQPERVEVIWRAFQRADWWEKAEQVEPKPLPQPVLEAVHSPAYLNLLEMACRRGSHLDSDTYTVPRTWDLAHRSAAGAIAVAEAVWQGQTRSGFALCRPPGHHAMRGQGMGFCLLNNIALAAEALIRYRGAKRIAIVDLDLHHGNGTQDIFWRRRDVFFLSIHQSPFYPHSGSIEEQGEGAGFGFSANFPLPPLSGDSAYQAVMEQLILPLLDRYSPEMILVSYGFDAHWLDPLGQILLSADGIARLMSQLRAWSETNCQGKIAAFLEGGYNLEAAETCSLAAAHALLGLAWDDPLGPAPYPESERWRAMLSRAKEVWTL